MWYGDLGVSTVVRRAGQDFGAVQQIAAVGTPFTGPANGGPAIAVRPDGRAAIAFPGSADGQDPAGVELSRSDANGSFEPAAFVTPAGQDIENPALAWPAGSGIHLAWQGSKASYDAALAAVAPADGPLGVLAEHAYEDVDSDAGVQVLAAAGGTMTFFQPGDGSLRSVNRKPQDPEAQLREDTINAEPADWKRLSATSDATGDAVVGWDTRETPWLPTLSVWDASGPAVTVSAPDTVTAGQPLRLTVGATDAFSGVASRSVSVSTAAGAPVAGPAVGADGTVTATIAQPGTYTLTGRATDDDGNAATATRTVTVVAAPRAPVVVKVTCEVPSLRNHSVAYARPADRRALPARQGHDAQALQARQGPRDPRAVAAGRPEAGGRRARQRDAGRQAEAQAQEAQAGQAQALALTGMRHGPDG